MKVKDILAPVFAGLFLIGAIALSIWWTTYRFHDCRNVGHSLLYCIMDIGS